jgi:hypothetical protein
VFVDCGIVVCITTTAPLGRRYANPLARYILETSQANEQSQGCVFKSRGSAARVTNYILATNRRVVLSHRDR